MARIAGVNIPPQKRVGDRPHLHLRRRPLDLQRASSRQLGIDPDTKVRDLTEEEVVRLREAIDGSVTVEGDLRRERSQNIKRLMEIGCYRGIRHRRGMPVQRPAHQDQRAHPQGPQEDRRRRAQEVSRKRVPTEVEN